MQSVFAVKNASSKPCISVNIDDERVFTCILRNRASPSVFIDCGSIAVSVYDNHEKKFLDRWISVLPHRRNVLSVYDDFMTII